GTRGCVAVGDFDGDGVRDLVVAGSGTVSVLLGKGDGTFQAAMNFPVGGCCSYPFSVAEGDFNGDGVPDLAADSSSGVAVLPGNGDGTFQAAQAFRAGSGSRAIAVGDFNRDGVLDLAVAGG